MSTRNATIWMTAVVVLVLCGAAKAEWSEAVPVTEINTEYAEWDPFLSSDGLSLYFSKGKMDTFYYHRLYEAMRQVPYGPFTSIREISELNYSGGHIQDPWVSQDNLRLYYMRTEPGSRWRLKFSERTSVGAPWPLGANISELNALGQCLRSPTLTADELTIFFSGHWGNPIPGSEGDDVWMATRPDRNSPFGNMTNQTGINTAAHEGGPSISPDGLTLVFHSDRNGEFQLFKATRETLTEPFGNVECLSVCGTQGSSAGPCLSRDSTAVYFRSWIHLGDIYVSYLIEDPHELAVIQIEDAIAQKEEILEAIDEALEKEWAAYDALEELLESNEKDYDGLKKGDIVKAGQKIHSAIQHEQQSADALEKSIKELEKALAALGWEPEPEPEPDPNLVSYWKFEEGQGGIAYDSAGDNDGTIYGAQWTTGQVGGALEFDGVNDCVDIGRPASLMNMGSATLAMWFKPNFTINDTLGRWFVLFGKNVSGVGAKGDTFLGFCPASVCRGRLNLDIITDTGPHPVVSSDSDFWLAGDWQHVAVSWDNVTGEMRMFINGVEQADKIDNFTGLAMGADRDVIIGSSSEKTQYWWDGAIDEVAIWNRALSAEEIQELYQEGLN